MVRAILKGSKTQTRRILKDTKFWKAEDIVRAHPPHPSEPANVLIDFELTPSNGVMIRHDHIDCPYGQPGDRLWVRETFAILGNEDGCPIYWDGSLAKGVEQGAARIFRASCERRQGDYGLWSIPDREMKYEGAWRPSIHMPRWASRILLEIVSVRVERLQDISEADARAEGIQRCWHSELGSGYSGYEEGWSYSAHGAFRKLWDHINGHDASEANPWVWVVEFKRVEAE